MAVIASLTLDNHPLPLYPDVIEGVNIPRSRKASKKRKGSKLKTAESEKAHITTGCRFFLNKNHISTRFWFPAQQT